MRWVWVFLRNVLVTGPVAFLMFLLLEQQMGMAILVAVCFGLGFAILDVGISAWRTRGIPAGSLWPRQTLQLRVSGTVEETGLEVAAILRSLPTQDIEFSPDRVSARMTKNRWIYNAGRVTVDLRPNGNNTNLTIRTKPAAPWVISDYGSARKTLSGLDSGLTRMRSDGRAPAG
jgi:hypothetical protein